MTNIRHASTDEIPFIYDSWIKNWKSSRWAGCVPNHLIVRTTKDTIHGLIGRGADLKVFAVSGRVLSWVCHEVAGSGEAIVHAGYTKSAYRGRGVFDELLDHIPGTKPGFYTHRTDYLEHALRGKGTWRHAPEIARRK